MKNQEPEEGSEPIMSRFLQALCSGRLLLMDGAMGTELLRAGLPSGSCGEEWNLTHPDRVLVVHRAYRQAGAEVLLTNTFQANPPALARHGLADRLPDIAEAAVRLARQAAGPHAFVLGDIGPILGPEECVEFADRRQLHTVLTALEGVDGFLLETCSSPQALAAIEYALRGHPEAGAVPLLLSLTYRRDAAGRLTTFSGHGPATFARHAFRHGVAGLGVNCGRDIGPKEILEIIHCYRQETDVPLFARPNAGPPDRLLAPAEMAAQLEPVMRAGVAMIGGCCGTTPEHIRYLAAQLAVGPVPARRTSEG